MQSNLKYEKHLCIVLVAQIIWKTRVGTEAQEESAFHNVRYTHCVRDERHQIQAIE